MSLTEQFIIECANLLSRLIILCYSLLKTEVLSKIMLFVNLPREGSVTSSSLQLLYTWALAHSITETELLSSLIIWKPQLRSFGVFLRSISV